MAPLTLKGPRTEIERAGRFRPQRPADAGQDTQGNTYYACGYRIAYGDNAAEALGHGKWQYIREDRLTDQIDHFFKTYIFGPNAVAHFRSQHTALAPTLNDKSTEQRERAIRSLADLDQRIARQIAAIESGVDPVLVGERIRALKAERQQTEAALATPDLEQRQRTTVDLNDACAILEALPDLSKSLAQADPELRRHVYEAFQFAVELDRDTPEVRMKALVSSAFGAASDLDSIAATIAHKTIAGERSVPYQRPVGAGGAGRSVALELALSRPNQTISLCYDTGVR